MKHTIITCDLCGCRILKDRWWKFEKGAVLLRAKELKVIDEEICGRAFQYSDWKRSKYYICPNCVQKIKKICKGDGGAEDGK